MQAGLSSSFSSYAMAVYSLWTKDRFHIDIRYGSPIYHISSRMKWIRWDLTSRMKLIASSATPTKKWLNPTFWSLPSVWIYGEKRKRKPHQSEEGEWTVRRLLSSLWIRQDKRRAYRAIMRQNRLAGQSTNSIVVFFCSSSSVRQRSSLTPDRDLLTC